MLNLDDASDDDGRLLEQVGDTAVHRHNAFTAHLHHQLGYAVRHAQLHLTTAVTIRYDTIRYDTIRYETLF